MKEINIKESERGKGMNRVKQLLNTLKSLLLLLGVGFLLSSGSGGFLFLNSETRNEVNQQNQDVEGVSTTDVTQNQNEDSYQADKNEKSDQRAETFVYEKLPAVEGEDFFEELATIDGQPAYIASPITVELSTLPHVVIYSHGSNTTVISSMDSPFMLDLRQYAEKFTEAGYIFAASNQHGANWGSTEAVEDTEKLRLYIRENLQSSNNLYLIGYSMGGLPTLQYGFKYGANIEKIGLLAPTSYATAYSASNFEAIKDIPIRIWHGEADVNVPHSLSVSLQNRATQYGVNIELISIPNKGHWDLDTEYIDQLILYFETEN